MFVVDLVTEVQKIKMDTQKAQIVERLKQANNILVTVSANPSVDQLASAIGITLLLNKLGKHATAVFSGKVPSILEFLEPSKTLETNTDSLRDFIISLDKNKADKLRYKVEDNHVRIFITPYRTSISDKDLVFSQGDFNVEVVLAVGISKQQDLDQAIAAHGRILHDATVIDVSTDKITGLGTMNLIDPKASSLSEILVSIGVALKPDVLDSQMATAFLTGIVAQTNRFSNEKTTSETMEVSSKLLAAGANQQLVAVRLQPPKPATPPPPQAPKTLPQASSVAQPVAAGAAINLPEPVADQVAPDGSLQIDHGPAVDLDSYEFDAEAQQQLEQIRIDDQGHLKAVQPGEEPKASVAPSLQSALSSSPESDATAGKPALNEGGDTQLDAPSMGGTLTASGKDNETEKAVNLMAEPASASERPLLSHNTGQAPNRPAFSTDKPLPTDASQEPVVQASNTLEDLERSVQSPHVADSTSSESEPSDGTSAAASAPPVLGTNVDEARDAVSAAVTSNDQPLPPIEALGAQYVDLPGVGGTAQTSQPPVTDNTSAPPNTEDKDKAEPPTDTPEATGTPAVSDPSAPPPVPPPMMPPAFTPAVSDSSASKAA